VTGKGVTEKKAEKVTKRKRKLPAAKKQATVNDDSEEICSAETCLQPTGALMTARLCSTYYLYC